MGYRGSALCNCALADIIGVGAVDYQYHATAQNGAWTEVSDPGYGAPEWYTLPPRVSPDQWIYVPNHEQPDIVKELWLQVEFAPGTTAPTSNPHCLDVARIHGRGRHKCHLLCRQ